MKGEGHGLTLYGGHLAHAGALSQNVRSVLEPLLAEDGGKGFEVLRRVGWILPPEKILEDNPALGGPSTEGGRLGRLDRAGADTKSEKKEREKHGC